MSHSNLDETKKSSKRSRTVVQTDDSTEGVEGADPLNPHPPAKRQKKPCVLPPWADIPRWTSDRSPLMEMPLEIWDKIFSVASGLALQDHMAIAGTCKRIRRAYTDDVWKALESIWYNRFNSITNHIFSTANITPQSPADENTSPSICSYQEQIADAINTRTINLTSARSTYKVTEKEIMTLPHEVKRNPHGRYMAPMKLFCSARVRALALRVHGGPLGHAAHLKKLAEKDAKAKETRRRNGTAQVRKPRPVTPVGFPMVVIAVDGDDYDGYDGYDGYD